MDQAWVRWITLVLFALAGPAVADVLETRDGRLVEGTYLGGTQQAVRFEVDGNVEVLRVEDVLAVTFTRSGAPEPAAAEAAEAAPEAAAAQAAPTLARVPAGTRLHVRMTDGIDPRQSAVDDRFSATLETALGADGTVIVPVGTKAYGRVAELRSTGPVPSRLKLELTQLMLAGELLGVVTGTHQLPSPADAEPAPANASTIPARPGVVAGTVLEFRLLQPFDLRIQ